MLRQQSFSHHRAGRHGRDRLAKSLNIRPKHLEITCWKELRSNDLVVLPWRMLVRVGVQRRRAAWRSVSWTSRAAMARVSARKHQFKLLLWEQLVPATHGGVATTILGAYFFCRRDGGVGWMVRRCGWHSKNM